MPSSLTLTERLATSAQFQTLGDVLPEIEDLANLTSRTTRCAYENAIRISRGFTGIP